MVRVGHRGFVEEVELRRDRVHDWSAYPFSLPAIRQLDELRLDPFVTFFVGENGSGKSTLVEALAVAAGLNPEGGSKHMSFETRSSHSELHACLRLVRSMRSVRTSYFLRAESFFNVATQLERMGPDGLRPYGGRSLHEQSHGESFLSLVLHRFGADGFYVLDEPEAALSMRGQLALLRRMHDLCADGSQFIVATHSPILLAYPEALIYELDDSGIERTAYRATSQYQLAHDFLAGPDRFLRHLFSDD